MIELVFPGKAGVPNSAASFSLRDGQLNRMAELLPNRNRTFAETVCEMVNVGFKRKNRHNNCKHLPHIIVLKATNACLAGQQF